MLGGLLGFISMFVELLRAMLLNKASMSYFGVSAMMLSKRDSRGLMCRLQFISMDPGQQRRGVASISTVLQHTGKARSPTIQRAGPCV